MLETLSCRLCGGELQEESGTYICASCGRTFVRKTEDDYAKKLRDAIKEEKYEKVSAVRRNLWAAMHEEYISSEKCVSCARELKLLVPENYYAEFAEVANGKNDRELSEFLNSTTEDDMKTYADAVLDFMLKQGAMTSSTVTAVCGFIDRAFANKTSPVYIKYLNMYESEVEKVNACVYEPTFPREVFLAYSSSDMPKVIELCEYLENQKISCFLALRNLRHGRGAVDNYDAAIKTAMDNCRIILYVSSISSRSLDCDAYTIEIPYIRGRDRERAPVEYANGDYAKIPAKYKRKRIEYLLDDYTGAPVEKVVKDFFKGYEWCRTLEDVAVRAFKILTEEPVTADGAKSEAVKKSSDEKSSIKPAVEATSANEDEDRKSRKADGGASAEKVADDRMEAEDRDRKEREEKRKAEEERRSLEAEERRKKEEAERLEHEKREAAEKAEREKKEAEIRGKREELLKSNRSRGLDYEQFGDDECVISGIGRCKDKDIVIPSEYDGKPVTRIGDSAFFRLSSLTSITLPDTVTEIGANAFSGCSGIASIIIPGGVTSIGASAFSDCTSLTSVCLPDKLPTVSDSVFSGCTALSSIAVPDSVTSIGVSAFCGCKSLTSFAIPKFVTSIGDSAFNGCTALTSIAVPDSVTSIGDYAFNDCTSLSSITLSNSLAAIGSRAFLRCLSLTSIAVPESVKTVGFSAFADCLSLTDVYITDIGAWSTVSFVNSDANPMRYAKNLYLNSQTLSVVTVPRGVTRIGSYAFCGCTFLRSVSIPDSVTQIGEGAFLNCLSLTSITVPKEVKQIDKEAFLGCKKLVEVCNLSSLPISSGSEENGHVAKYAKNVYSQGESKIFTTYDGYIFYNDGKSHCLVGYFGIETSLTLPDDVGFSYEIYQYALYGCSSLSAVTLSDSVTAIGDYAFKDCSSLKTATIPDSVKSISEGAFSGCSSLESMTLPFVGGEANAMSASPESHLGYIFGEKEYDNGARTAQRNFSHDASVVFYIPSSLKSVVITGGEIPFGAFSNCSSIETVSIVGIVTSIYEGAFFGCTSLKSITIPATVTWIGGTAFSGCTSLRNVYFPGNRTQWRRALRENYYGEKALKKSLRKATINFNCKN